MPTSKFAMNAMRTMFLGFVHKLALMLLLGLVSKAALAQVTISVSFGPPPLPVYEQPLCPGEGYIWVPGYWAWDPAFDDYYWVPGTWVLAPQVGYLWTPPWWGWENGVFIFHEGWWGPAVGFYGGINYGFGYFGVGFVGGRWEGDRFFYNRSVTNVNVVNVRNVYNETVNVRSENHVSFNGGPGGIDARPRPEEEAAAHERHLGPVAAQTQHVQAARNSPELRASANQGKPPIAASTRPAEFRGGSVIAAREAGGPYHPPANHGAATRAGGNAARPPVHPSDLSPIEGPIPRNTGNSKIDQKHQRQQEDLYNRQVHERQQLEQRQRQEHQRMQERNAPQEQYQRMEQRHQQETQQLEQRHAQQRERLSEKQQRPRR